MTAMTDAFIRAGRYGEDEIAQGLNEDTLLKALVENDAMRYYLRGAKKIIGATGISMTARREVTQIKNTAEFLKLILLLLLFLVIGPKEILHRV